GFTITDARVKRSGLDYWPHVRLSEFASWDAFVEERRPREDQLFLFGEHGARSFYEPGYPEDAILVFGQETKGIPEAIWRAWPGRQFRLPMRSDVIRSLNLANTVAAAAYQALRRELCAMRREPAPRRAVALVVPTDRNLRCPTIPVSPACPDRSDSCCWLPHASLQPRRSAARGRKCIRARPWRSRPAVPVMLSNDAAFRPCAPHRRLP